MTNSWTHPSLTRAVDAVKTTMDDRPDFAGDAVCDRTLGAEVDRRGDSGEHEAARIGEHPLLAALAPEPMVSFTFDGTPVEGRHGEPIAVALLAAGFRVFRTMPRFGDARGGYCMVGRCADCLVVVDGVPNVLACVTPLTTGLDVRTQHGLAETGETSSPVADQ